MQKKWTNTIINWYSLNKRELPWRNTRNPYYIWLSEVILQQTKVQQGLPYYERFIEEFPSVLDLANASEKKVLKLWQGLGYYSRARNLHASAKYISNELKGEFPTTYTTIVKLKGVGDYTASAIASICFYEVTAVVDGNVFRVLSRYFGIDTPINTTQGAKQFKELAQQLIDEKRPDEFNQAIMEFGARQCKPKNPDCSICVFNNSCYALQHDKVGVLPIKLKKLKIKKRYFNYIVLLSRTNKTVLKQREKGIWQGLYQFPLIESDSILSNKGLNEMLPSINELNAQEFQVELYNEEPIIHKLSHQHLYTHFWIIKLDANLDKGIDVESISLYPVPVLISKFIDGFFVKSDQN